MTNHRKLINAEYPKYNNPPVKLEKLSIRAQYNRLYAKTKPALAPEEANARHCQW